MAKISLIYPDTQLSISISIINRDTGEERFSGEMTEVGSTKTYIFSFEEESLVDYIYIATVDGYSDLTGILYRKTDFFLSGGKGSDSIFDTSILEEKLLEEIDKKLDTLKDLFKQEEKREEIDFSQITNLIKEQLNNKIDYNKIENLIINTIKSIKIIDNSDYLKEIEQNIKELKENIDIKDGKFEENFKKIEKIQEKMIGLHISEKVAIKKEKVGELFQELIKLNEELN